MKYEPVFKLPYSNVFITDLLFKFTYKHLDSIAVIKNGKWEIFIKKEFLDKIAEQRYKEVIDGLDFKEFERNSLKLAKELIELKDFNVENLSNNEFILLLDKLFDIGGRFMANYSKTEFIHFKRIEK